MENILVAGANGTTGKKIVNLLSKSHDFNPVAMVRKKEDLAQFISQNIETVLADLEENLDFVFETSIDKVLFAAGSGGKNVIGVDQEGAKNLIDASKKAGIKKFVMLSSMGAENPEDASQLKDYLKAKHNADEYLKISGLNYNIVRPGKLTNESPTGSIELETKLDKQGEISRADVAQTLVQSLYDHVAPKTTFEIINGNVEVKKALEKIN